MYKIKIVFLYKDSKGNCTWSHQWANCNHPKEIGEIVPAYHEAEEKALKEDNIDKEVEYAAVVEVQDVSKGDYQCDGCGCYFDTDDPEFCPYCDCSVIEEVSKTEKTAPQTFSGPRLHKP
jgi:rubrerythrin